MRSGWPLGVGSQVPEPLTLGRDKNWETLVMEVKAMAVADCGLHLQLSRWWPTPCLSGLVQPSPRRTLSVFPGAGDNQG